MSARLPVGVIGVGALGQHHARHLARLDEVHLVGVCDIDPARSERIAAELGTAAFVEIDDLLARAEAVTVAVPTPSHAAIGLRALDMSVPVLMEKPLAATLDEADAMIAAAERAGVVLMVAENVRFEAVYRAAQALLEAGAIGEPALVQVSRQAYLRRSFLEERPWFLDAKRAAGGIMMSGGVHDFETMRMLVGELASVQALRAPQRFLEMEGDDTSVALVRFRSGAVGTLVESFLSKSLVTAAGPEVHSLRVDGALGSLSVTRGETSVDTIRLFSEREEYRVGGAPAEQRVLVPASDSFAEEIGHFLECLRTGREPLTSGRTQRRPLEAILAAYRSMESGAQVLLGG
jgi:predicted dehydrogenase